MKATILALTLLIGTPAMAQLINPSSNVDQSARDAATQAGLNAASASAAAASASAAIPAPCPTAPIPDSYSATPGTGTPCTTRPDATRQTVVQSARGTTATDGTFTIAWPSQSLFATMPTYAHAEILSASAPYQCDVGSVSTTTITGKCFMLVSSSLPTLATSLLGLVITPYGSASSLTVMVVGRQ